MKIFLFFIFFNLLFLNFSFAIKRTDPTHNAPAGAQNGGIGTAIGDPMTGFGIRSSLSQAVDVLNAGKKGHIALAAGYAAVAKSLPSPEDGPWWAESFLEGAKALAFEKAEDKTYEQCIKVSETNTCKSDVPDMSDLTKDLDFPAESPFVNENGETLNYDDAFSDLDKVHIKKGDKNIPLSSLTNPSLANFSKEELENIKNPNPKAKEMIEKLRKKNEAKMKNLASKYVKKGSGFAFKKGDAFDLNSILNQILRKKKITDLRAKKDKLAKNKNALLEKDQTPSIFKIISNAYKAQMKKIIFLFD